MAEKILIIPNEKKARRFKYSFVPKEKYNNIVMSTISIKTLIIIAYFIC